MRMDKYFRQETHAGLYT